MPVPTAQLRDSAAAQTVIRSIANDKNRESQLIMTGNPYKDRKPEFYVGIFNVSRRELVVERPWAINGTVRIEARKEDALYGKPFVLADIELIHRPIVGNDEILTVPQKGEFLAQDIVNSNDPNGSWKTYKAANPATEINIGNNYYEKGIFWVRLATPDSEPDLDAVEAAIDRLELNYNRLIMEANELYASGPEGQKQLGAGRGKPYHEAADYFITAGHEVDAPWHSVMKGGLSNRLKDARRKAEATNNAAQAQVKPVTKI
jgi:hypothetical protein